MKNISWKFIVFQSYFIIFMAEIAFSIVGTMTPLLFFSEKSVMFGTDVNHTVRSQLYGITVFITHICAMLAFITISSLSDKTGRKSGLLVSFTGYIVMLIFCIVSLFLQSLVVFIIAMIIGYLTYSARPIITASIIDNTNKQSRLTFVSMIQFFIGLGFTIGPLIAGYLSHQKLNNLPFFVIPYIIAIGIFLILISIVIKFFPKKQKKESDKEKIKFRDVKSLFSNKITLILIIILVFNQFSWGTFYQFIPAVSKAVFNFSDAQIAHIYSSVGICLMVTSIIIIPLLNKIFKSQKILFIIGALILCFGVNSTIFSSYILNSNFLWLGIALTISGDVIIFSLIVTFISMYSNKNIHGASVGVLYMIGSGVSWAIGGLLSGYLTKFSEKAPLFISSLSSFILIIFILIFCVVTKRTIFPKDSNS